MEHNTFFAHQYARILMALVLGSAVIALLAFANNMHQQADGLWGPTTIAVNGEGEVQATPDIGSFSFSVLAEGTDAAAAQSDSAESVNAILAYLDEQGVAEKDIKTQNYNLNPRYRFEERTCVAGSFCPPGDRVIDGYEVSQNVTVKVRNLDEAGDLISGVGERGATNISSLQFTIDDQSVYEAEARSKAIADAKEKAKALAKDLGMTLGDMVGFHENTGGYGGGFMQAETRAFSMEADVAAFAPELPVGENTISSNVNLTFEIK